MKAIVLTKYGPPDVLRLMEVPEPAPQNGEVLIRIRAATVSTADCEVRSFAFPAWIWLPLRLGFGVFRPRKAIRILGQELAGDVEAIGEDVTDFKIGDAVAAPIAGFGAHTEYICLPAAGAIAKKPANISYEDACAFTAFALNALHFIRKAKLERGRRILINGAGGGMGTTAVQLAKHFGAEVTAVDSAEKLEMLRAIGADHVIDCAREDFTRSGATYDVILDIIGKSPYGRSIRSLAPNGRYILANPRAIPMLRGLWTSRTSDKKVLFALAAYRSEELEFLMTLAATGTLKAVIDRRYTLEQAAEAHAYVQSGRKKGHVVLTMDHDA